MIKDGRTSTEVEVNSSDPRPEHSPPVPPCWQDRTMPRTQPVSSSSVRAVGYDEQLGRLVLEYDSGGRYVYYGVPPSVHRDLLTADSIGRYVNTMIKPRYPSEPA